MKELGWRVLAISSVLLNIYLMYGEKIIEFINKMR